jgi:ABC-type multidrug transport system fused ATPase/permease subunit
MKNGRIAEQGRFDELMEAKGYFYSLFTVSQE